jgi:sugar phosphate isomerase/epimerase
MNTIEARRAVSTWSLHRLLGNFVSDDSAVGGGRCLDLPAHPDGKSLIDLLPGCSERGYLTVQICHFHLESRSEQYLHRVRTRLDELGIALEMLLIDAGDLMAPEPAPHLDFYHRWLEAAEILGASRARICAGRSAPTQARIESSGHHLAELAADHPGVRIVIENWLEATPDAASVLSVLDAAGPAVGLLIDLGNWSAPEIYQELALIAPRAESCHAKCHFSPAGPDLADFERSLRILDDTGFTGPISLIYDGPDDDEWSNLALEWEIVKSTLGQSNRAMAR